MTPTLLPCKKNVLVADQLFATLPMMANTKAMPFVVTGGNIPKPRKVRSFGATTGDSIPSILLGNALVDGYGNPLNI
jgi:hypothetical protein